MDSRYGIHTIELFHRVSKKDFNKVFQHLKSLNFGKLYPDATYHSDKGIEKYICISMLLSSMNVCKRSINWHNNNNAS